MTLFVNAMGFDSVGFGIPNEYTFDEQQKLLERLDDLKETHYPRTGIRTYTGYLRGVRIEVKFDIIIVTCSVSKLIRGNNLLPLSPDEMTNVYQCIGELLVLPISLVKKAILLSVDFTCDLEMSYDPTLYFDEMGQYPRMKRVMDGSSLYYRNKNGKLLFYDKILEIISNKYLIPEYWRGKKILRYERRVFRPTLKKICKDIGIGLPELNMLEDYRLYLKLVEKWENGYEAIVKKATPSLDPKAIMLPKDLDMWIRVNGLAHLGGADAVLSMIDRRFMMAPSPRKEYRSRMKRSVKDVNMSPSFSLLSPLIEELDSKVANKVLELTSCII